MKNLLVLSLCLVSALAAPQSKYVPVCEETKCKLPACKCARVATGNPGNKPQFLILSFDDAVSKLLYTDFIKPTFVNRKNPDGCPVSGTFFIPHEYTNYSIVNTLYGHGFEIASHSITKNFLQAYWRNATISTLQSELAGQREILSKFANISKSAIIGARIPQLQINANTFEALKQANFSYDSTWPTMQYRPFTPYTLDFATSQTCHVNDCQVKSIPGLWEMPIIDWINQDGDNCNSIDACAVKGDANKIFEWMKKNFNAINKTGAPISFRINYSWFIADSTHQTALQKFLDFIGTLKDTFIVSYKQVLDWTRNPTGNFTSCQNIKKPACVPRDCAYNNGPIQTNYISVCGKCPYNYPTLDNPLGEL